MTDKTKKIATEFLKKVIGKTTEEVVAKIIIFFLGLLGLWLLSVNWQIIINFLQVKIPVAIYLIIVLSIATLILGYLIGKPKKRKWWFELYENVLWKAEPYTNEVFVENYPYCSKCNVKYLIVSPADYFDKCYNMICPSCGDKKENYPVTVIRNAVTNIVNAKFHGHYK